MSDLPFDSIINIHSNPRSGSTWLAQILNSHPDVRYKYQPLKSRTFNGRINDHSPVEEVYRFLREVYHTEDDYLDQRFQQMSGEVPVPQGKLDEPSLLLLKMVRYHYLVPFLLKNIPEQKIIGLVRHPCAYLNSWRKAPKEFLPEWDFQEEWYFGQSYNQFRSGEYYGFHRWKEVARMFLEMEKTHPDRFLLLRYEDLVRSTEKWVAEVLNFAGLQLTEEVTEFLEKSRQIEVDKDYSVFRGSKNLTAWREELPTGIKDRVEGECLNTELEYFLDI